MMEQPTAPSGAPSVTIKLEKRAEILAKAFENLSVISTLLFVFATISFLGVATPKSSGVTYDSDTNALLGAFLSLTIGVSAVSLIMSFTNGYKIRMFLGSDNISKVQECVEVSSQRYLHASRLTTSLSVALFISSLIIAAHLSRNSDSDLSSSSWLLGMGLLFAILVS